MQTDPSPTLSTKTWTSASDSVKILHDHSNSSEHRQIHIEASLLDAITIKDIINKHYESVGYKTEDTTFFHNDSVVFSFSFQKNDLEIIVRCHKLKQKRQFLIQIMT